MAFVNGLICVINVVILFMVIANVREIQNNIQHEEKVKSDIKALLKENTDLATAIIDELEKKLTVAEGFKEYLDSKESAEKTKNIEQTKVVEEKLVSGEGKSAHPLEKTAAKIISLKESGLSKEDIAEELGVSQGEIELQIRLHNKKERGVVNETDVNRQ